MFQKNQVVYTKGLNSQCNPVVTKVVFQKYLPKEDIKTHVSPHTGNTTVQDCVVITSGFKMIDDSSTLFATKKEVIL